MKAALCSVIVARIGSRKSYKLDVSSARTYLDNPPQEVGGESGVGSSGGGKNPKKLHLISVQY